MDKSTECTCQLCRPDLKDDAERLNKILDERLAQREKTDRLAVVAPAQFVPLFDLARN